MEKLKKYLSDKKSSSAYLVIHDIIKESSVNGPGRRFTIWVQGCTHKCPGCFNPETHKRSNGRVVSIKDLFQQIIDMPDIEGISISGGEPLQQIKPVLHLLYLIKTKTNLSTLVFTGYYLNEIRNLSYGNKVLDYIDIAITGRYNEKQHKASSLIGSNNQEVLFLSDRYEPFVLDDVEEAEILILEDGRAVISGIAPPEELMKNDKHK